MNSVTRAFCAEILHRLPSEINAPMSDLHATMIAVAVEREKAIGDRY